MPGVLSRRGLRKQPLNSTFDSRVVCCSLCFLSERTRKKTALSGLCVGACRMLWLFGYKVSDKADDAARRQQFQAEMYDPRWDHKNPRRAEESPQNVYEVRFPSAFCLVRDIAQSRRKPTRNADSSIIRQFRGRKPNLPDAKPAPSNLPNA